MRPGARRRSSFLFQTREDPRRYEPVPFLVQPFSSANATRPLAGPRAVTHELDPVILPPATGIASVLL